MAFDWPGDAVDRQSRLRHLAETSSFGTLETDAGGACIRVDENFTRVTGLSRQQALGNGWLREIFIDDADRMRERWAQTVLEGKPLTSLFRYTGVDGVVVWIRHDAQPVRDTAGALSGFSSRVSDVTELMSLAEALEHNRQEFRFLAEAMPQLVWSTNAQGGVDYFNERWIEYTHLTVERMRHTGQKGVVHPDDVALTWERWSQALASGEAYEIEYRLRRASDGSYRWFIARAVPVRDAQGNVQRWIGTATDIDAQKRLSENLKFVLTASNAFSESFDVAHICKRFAELSIRQFADWCFVTLMRPDGSFETAAIEHRDRSLVEYVEQFRDRYPVQSDGELAAAIAERKARLYPTIQAEQIEASARDDQHLALLRKLQMHSAMIVPLFWEGQTYGGIVLVTSESRRAFDAGDLEVAEMVAGRAALAIHNANILSHERRAAQRLRFLAEATDALFESLDTSKSLQRLAELIVPALADFAVVVSIEDDHVLRTVAAAHRDAVADPVLREIAGQRVFKRDAEYAIVRELRTHKPLIHAEPAADRLRRTVRPYLQDALLSLNIDSSIAVPLYSRGETYGGLLAFYCDSTRRYAEDDLPVFVELGRRASIAVENAQTYERERRIAATLQQASLPSALPDVEGVRLDAVYRPSQSEAQVGGDWYDAFLLEDGSLVITMGDVAGRGVHAATIMAKMRHALAVLPLYESDPARMLDAADYVLRRRFKDAIVTAFVGVIDPQRRTIHYANAGHPYPIVRSKDGLVELAASGLPLGLRRESTPDQAQRTSIEDAQAIVFFTDGLIESTHDVGEGERRLRALMSTEAVLHCANPAVLIEEACLYDGSPDDVAILTAVLGNPVRWRFESDNARLAQDARSEFVAYLRQRINDPDVLASAELVFGELVGNVVRHAPGPLEVEVEWNGPNPVLHLIDRGPKFANLDALPGDLMSEFGRGLFIIHSLTQALRMEYIPNYGNHITAVLSVDPRKA